MCVSSNANSIGLLMVLIFSFCFFLCSRELMIISPDDVICISTSGEDIVRYIYVPISYINLVFMFKLAIGIVFYSVALAIY